MSTASFWWPLLLFLLPLTSLAGPPYTASLPASAIAQIPSCAQDCVKNFIDDDFSKLRCPSPVDLDCLCTAESASGYTLGERAVYCLETVPDCINQSKSEALEIEVNLICGNTPNAKSATHRMIMTTLIITPDLSSSTTSYAISTIRTSQSSKPAGNVPPLPSSSFPIISSTGPSSTITPLPTSPVTETTKPALTRSYIAGIAAGGVVGIAIALGLFFIYCRPRKSKNRLSDSSFGNDKIVDSRPVTPRNFLSGNEDPEQTRGISTRSGPIKTVTPEQAQRLTGFTGVEQRHNLMTPNRKTASGTTLVRRSLYPDGNGLGEGSETRERLLFDDTPPSAASDGTTSQLLPDKPNLYSLFPPPLRVQTSRSSVSPNGGSFAGEAGISQRGQPLAKPSPRLGRCHDTSSTPVQLWVSPMHASTSDPFIDSSSGPRAITYGDQRREPLRLKTPSSNRPHPKILTYEQQRQFSPDLPKPVPARHSSSARGLNRQKTAYNSPDLNHDKGRHSSQPLVYQPSLARRDGRRTMKGNGSAASVIRESSASDTVFEEDTDDEERPPLPTFHPALPRFKSSDEIAHPVYPNSAATRSFSRRLPPKSPTPQPTRRNQPQPQPPPLTTRGFPAGAGNRTEKALPAVPVLPDTPTTPRFGQRQEKIPISPRNNTRAIKEVRKTAKWQILVSPGLDGIENSSILRLQGDS